MSAQVDAGIAGGETDGDMDRLLGEFRRAQRRRNLSPLTITHRCHQVRSFGLWLLEKRGTGLLEAEPHDIDGWLDSKELSASTRYTYLCYLRSFYRYAVRSGATKTNPVDLIEPPKRPKRLPRPTDDDELALAIEYAEPRMAAMLHLTALQGFRCIEVSRLRVEDIDRRSMMIRAWGKGDKERVMRLHPATLTALTAYGLPSHGWVFRKQTEGCETEPLSAATISRYVGRHMHSLGSSSTAHRNRHWFGTNVYSSCRDLLVTRDLLGHSSARTAELYAKVVGSQGESVVDGLSIG